MGDDLRNTQSFAVRLYNESATSSSIFRGWESRTPGDNSVASPTVQESHHRDGDRLLRQSYRFSQFRIKGCPQVMRLGLIDTIQGLKDRRKRRPSVARECQKCGAAFKVKPSQVDKGGGKYCSRKCLYAAWLPELARLNVSRIIKLCQACGKAVSVKRSHAAIEGSYCSKNCMAHGYRQRLRGTANPNYRDGRGNSAGVRARRRQVDGYHSADDIALIRLRQRNRCVYCSVTLNRYHVDHIVPLIRGGSNWPSNLQLLCARCNQRKHCQKPEVFARKMGFLL